MSWRLFLAVTLPETTATSLARWVAGLESQASGWRWVAAENLHVTLRFLGAVDADRASGLSACLEEVPDGLHSGCATVRGWGTFPPRGVPRVLWAGIDDPQRTLASLAAKAERWARRAGFEPEDRPFRSHVTLARASKGSRPRVPDRDAQPEFGDLPIEQVVLMRSHLSARGPRYEPLACAALDGTAG